MPDGLLQRRFRLLLSWREKARQLSEAAGEHADDAIRTEHLRYLQQHADEAQRRLQALRKAQKKALLKAGQLLQETLAGVSDPQRVEALRAEIALLNRLVSAEHSSELGGFIDLPIGEYPLAAGLTPMPRAPLPPEAGTTRLRIAIAGALIALLGIGVVLYVLRWQREIEVQLLPPGPLGNVTAHLVNHTPSDVWIMLPGMTPPAGSPGPVCVFEVAARTDTSEEFRPITPSLDSWRVDGQPLMAAEEIRTLPGLRREIRFIPRNLPPMQPPLESLQLLCRSPGGDVLAEARIPLAPKPAP